MIKKYDIALGLCLIILGIASALYPLLVSETGGTLEVSVDGKHYGSYPLFIERKVKIKNGNCINIFEIKDGQVKMISASCKNQLCVKSRPISRTAQNIVCLPNHVMLRIVNDNKKDKENLDAIAN
ncbi:MAG: NusG domain II-containing protein [Eubacteriales bacterium]